jgi:hypothetical protein
MWEPWRLTNLWASMACYRDSYYLSLWMIIEFFPVSFSKSLLCRNWSKALQQFLLYINSYDLPQIPASTSNVIYFYQQYIVSNEWLAVNNEIEGILHETLWYTVSEGLRKTMRTSGYLVSRPRLRPGVLRIQVTSQLVRSQWSLC